jgi:beta-glucanase (GH16 family)
MRQRTVVGLGFVIMLAAAAARPSAGAAQAPAPSPASPATPASPAAPVTPAVPTTAPSPQTPSAPVAAESGATQFDDEFDGPALDRTKWNVIVTGRTVNNENEAYVDSPDTIDIVTGAAAEGADGGALRIRARYRPGYTSPEGRQYDFISGRLDTRGKVEFTYGTAAARMKLPAGAGFWPAFWLLGTGRWPDTGEADIMENVGDPSWTNAAMHGPGYFGNTPLVRRAPLPSGDVTDWHIYSVDWTPDSLSFKVDGQEMYRVTKTMVEQYGPWAYDNAKFLILNLAIGGQYPQSVNHATEPYPGLPQASVDLIKSDAVAVLVDWVRVTR